MKKMCKLQTRWKREMWPLGCCNWLTSFSTSPAAAALPLDDADVMFSAVALLFCYPCYDSWTYGIIYCGDTGGLLGAARSAPLSLASSEVAGQLLCHGLWLS